jgi:hypothetical protein
MALRTLTTLAAGPITGADDSGKLVAASELNPRLSFEIDVTNAHWQVSSLNQRTFVERGTVAGGSTTAWDSQVNHGAQFPRSVPHLFPSLAGSMLFRLEPDSLRQPTNLIPDGAPLRFMNSLGLGLPTIYDAIVTRDLPAYMALNDDLRRLFPAVKSIRLKNHSQSQKAFGVHLQTGASVGADFMSEGMLYFLAYAALRYLDPHAVILIEEPENGLHPSRVHDVMNILKEISKTTQVVIATHSPLVINELQPDEVTVVTRDATKGTQLTPIKDTPRFEERSKVYALAGCGKRPVVGSTMS